MAAALGVSLEDLIPGEDEEIELGDGAVMTPRAIRALLRDFAEFGKVPLGDIYRPGDARWAELSQRAMAEQDRLRLLLEPIIAWAKRQGNELETDDWWAALRSPSDAERHAARRLGVEPAQVRLSARALWRQDFGDERDARVGDASELTPRSRQAKRGLVTRAMLAELRALLDEAYAGEGSNGRAQP